MYLFYLFWVNIFMQVQKVPLTVPEVSHSRQVYHGERLSLLGDKNKRAKVSYSTQRGMFAVGRLKNH
jgi:hypothetical protein